MPSLLKLLSVFSLVYSCSQPVEQQSSIKNAELAIRAGGAFDSVRLKHLPRTCLSLRIEETDTTSEDFFLEKVDSSTDIARRVGFQVDGSFTYGLAKGEGKARLLSEVQSSERSVGFIAYKRVVSRVARAMDPALVNTYSYLDCGDKYVSSVSYGTEMMAMAKFIFSTSKFKKSFEASASGSYGSIGNLKASVATLDEQTKKDSGIIIRIHTDGDDLNIKGRLFNGEDALYCSLADFDRCAQVLTDIINYQNGDMRQAATRSHTVIRHELEDYPAIPVPEDHGLKPKLRQLDDQLKATSRDWDRALTLETFNILSSDEKSEVRQVRDEVGKNLQALQSNIRACLNSPERCNPSDNLRNYNHNLLETRTKEIEISINSHDDGVRGCQERSEEEARRQCDSKGADLPGEVIESRLELGEPHHWSEKNGYRNGWSGDKCKSDIIGSRCFLRIRL